MMKNMHVVEPKSKLVAVHAGLPLLGTSFANRLAKVINEKCSLVEALPVHKITGVNDGERICPHIIRRDLQHKGLSYIFSFSIGTEFSVFHNKNPRDALVASALLLELRKLDLANGSEEPAKSVQDKSNLRLSDMVDEMSIVLKNAGVGMADKDVRNAMVRLRSGGCDKMSFEERISATLDPYFAGSSFDQKGFVKTMNEINRIIDNYYHPLLFVKNGNGMFVRAVEIELPVEAALASHEVLSAKAADALMPVVESIFERKHKMI